MVTAETMEHRSGADTPEARYRSGDSDTAGMTDTARAQAGAIWNDAKDKARSTVEQQQRTAAAGIGDVADALKSAAHELEGKDSPAAAQVTQRAAEGLERVANALRSRDVTSMMHDVERFARQQPAVFLGAAVAAGFLAMRFLKASGEHRGEPPRRAGTEPARSHETTPAEPAASAGIPVSSGTPTSGGTHGYGETPR